MLEMHTNQEFDMSRCSPLKLTRRAFLKSTLLVPAGGSLKRSLGMVSLAFTIPKAFGFEAATQS